MSSLRSRVFAPRAEDWVYPSSCIHLLGSHRRPSSLDLVRAAAGLQGLHRDLGRPDLLYLGAAEEPRYRHLQSFPG